MISLATVDIGMKTKGLELFLNRARSKFGNKFDYSLVEYKNTKTKIKIICPIHGVFEQFPQMHLKGKGCPKCHLDTIRKTTKQFIDKAIKVHGNKYDYSKTKYTGAFNKVIIICPTHGEFRQIASDHTNNGKGCPRCYYDNKPKGLKEFIEESKMIHNNKYNYSLIDDYTTNMDKIPIICPIHGKFEQRPYQHTIKKHGCPLCPTVISKPHQEIIDYIKSIYNGDLIINDRQTIPGVELDIYIPDRNLAIEYHGLFWHSHNTKEKTHDKNRHMRKADMCFSNGINLFQIWEHEWTFKRNIIKSMISGKLGLNKRIFARKCKIVDVDPKMFRSFLDDNHLQGIISNPIRYGLMYNNELICVMGFMSHKVYQWELGRFASKKFTNVIGGASKLLNCFIKTYNPNSILSYANRNHSDGRMYKKLGFNLETTTNPGYHYTKKTKIFSRQQFQKHKLKDRLDLYDPSLSESDNMFNNEYRRFWNAGNYKFVYINKKQS